MKSTSIFTQRYPKYLFEILISMAIMSDNSTNQSFVLQRNTETEIGKYEVDDVMINIALISTSYFAEPKTSYKWKLSLFRGKDNDYFRTYLILAFPAMILKGVISSRNFRKIKYRLERIFSNYSTQLIGLLLSSCIHLHKQNKTAKIVFTNGFCIIKGIERKNIQSVSI
jgi:hypothetical protein